MQAVQHPSIGVEMMPITPSLAAQLNNQVPPLPFLPSLSPFP
jgi:hypothetical protein